MEYRFRLPIYEIDEDGDLKFVHFYNGNVVPQIGDTIVIMVPDEENAFARRIYYDIKNILVPTVLEDNEIKQMDEIVLHCIKTVDEPVNNGFRNE